MNRPVPPAFTLAANVLADMPHWLTATRHDRGLTLRQVANEVGVSIPAIARAERGLRCQAHTAVKILRWLGETRA